MTLKILEWFIFMIKRLVINSSMIRHSILSFKMTKLILLIFIFLISSNWARFLFFRTIFSQWIFVKYFMFLVFGVECLVIIRLIAENSCRSCYCILGFLLDFNLLLNMLFLFFICRRIIWRYWVSCCQCIIKL